MTPETHAMYFRAGEARGRKVTCGVKIYHNTEERARELAETRGPKEGTPLVAYPCFYCWGWHIGVDLTPEEVEQYSNTRLPTMAPDRPEDRWWE